MPPPVVAAAAEADQVAAPKKGRDLRALWDLAQARFPGLVAARHSVAAAEATLDEQRYLKLPGGELTTYVTGSPAIKCDATSVVDSEGRQVAGQFIGSDKCLSTNVNLSFTGPQADISKLLPVYGVLLRVDARIVQPVFTFGKLNTARDLARVGVELSRAAADAARAELALNVVRAYYGLKTVRAALETVKDGQEQIKKWVKQIDADLEKGKAGYSETDLARLKVAEAQVDLAVIDMQRTQRSTLAALRYLVQDPEADIDDEDLRPSGVEEQPLSRYLDAALAGRPELRTLEATGRGAELWKKMRIADLMPDLAVVGTVNYGLATGIKDQEITNAFINRFNYLGFSLGLFLRQPLDIGPRIARLRKAQADVAQFQARRKELLGGGALEIERVFNDMQEARGRLQAAEAAERRARGWLQGVKQAIDVGTAESRDMIDALRTYFEQHLLVLRTINDLNVQSATLRRVSGLDVVPRDG